MVDKKQLLENQLFQNRIYKAKYFLVFFVFKW